MTASGTLSRSASFTCRYRPWVRSFFALYHFCIFVLTFIAPTELEAAEQEGVDPEFLDSVEAGFEQAAETLVTMRKARARLAEVRKDRGYGRARGRKPPATAESLWEAPLL